MKQDKDKQFFEILRDITSNASDLTSVVLTSCVLDAKELEKLCSALEKNSTVKTLALGFNDIDKVGCAAIVQMLKNNHALETLNLERCRLGDRGMQSLADGLGENNSLRKLSLDDNEIYDDGAVALGQALAKNKTLLVLECSNNNIGNKGAMAIVSGLMKSGVFTELNLRKNKIGAMGGSAFGELLKENGTLRKLNLNENQLNADGAKQLGNALKKNKVLQSLSIGGNRIGNQGVEALMDGITSSSCLITLDLHNNEITPVGIANVVRILDKYSKLQSVNLSSNQLDFENLQTLAKWLKENICLKELSLTQAKIDSSGIKPLADVLVTNCTLTYLDLRVNAIDDVGADMFVKVLAGNTTLSELKLTGNKISIDKQKNFAALLKRNKEIYDELSVAENFIHHNNVSGLQFSVANSKFLKEYSYSALHVAVICGDKFIAQQLIAGGESITARNTFGKTPIDIAAQYKRPWLMNILIQETRLNEVKRQAHSSQLMQNVCEDKTLSDLLKEMSKADVLGGAKQQLWEVFNEIKREFSSDLQGEIISLIEGIDYPQRLLKHKGFSTAEKIASFIKVGAMGDTDPMFSNIQHAIKKIEGVESRLGLNSFGERMLNNLNIVIGIYRGYIKKICEASSESVDQYYHVPCILHISGQRPRILSTEVNALLSSYQRSEQAGSAAGSHIVHAIKGVHFKKQPEAPGIEFMVNSLGQAVGGRVVASTELLKLIDDQENSHCIQASKTVVGFDMQYIVQHRADLLSKIKPENFSAMIVLSLITDFEDGKPDNFIVECVKVNDNNEVVQLAIIGIDNDRAFADPIVSSHPDKNNSDHFVNIKNVLYFFPQMKDVIDRQFYRSFMALPPILIVIRWLKMLCKKNREYQKLLDEGIFSKEEFNKLQLPIRFSPGTIKIVYQKLQKIQAYLRKNPNACHEALFHHIRPIVQQVYQQCLEKNKLDIISSYHMLHNMSCGEGPTLEKLIGPASPAQKQIQFVSVDRERFVRNRTQSLADGIKVFLLTLDYSRLSRDRFAGLYNDIQSLMLGRSDKAEIESVMRYVVQNKIYNPSLFDHLLLLGLNLSKVFEGGDSFLHLCAQYKQKQTAQYLLEKKFHVNAVNNANYTALHIAASCDDISMIELLISYKIEINAIERHGETALDKAINREKNNAARLLIKRGANRVLPKHEAFFMKLKSEQSVATPVCSFPVKRTKSNVDARKEFVIGCSRSHATSASQAGFFTENSSTSSSSSSSRSAQPSSFVMGMHCDLKPRK